MEKCLIPAFSPFLTMISTPSLYLAREKKTSGFIGKKAEYLLNVKILDFFENSIQSVCRQQNQN